ncbi:hypothetical protein PAXINDRAFT_171197 [Paxillus involutus ATCC 200175]|uniref:FAD-binding PCMH-type domain-containing protein n=1 Tax=Paxillus involutus ATCC 200175 TaxID=664439 RepID=A0A0C9TPA8_PAXIN|nr:hypothetical protein PAXINDRAFT_171197 [Paxillus involutus ATCC 200175]
MTTISRKLRDAIEEITAICDADGSKSQCFPFGGEGYKSSVRHFLESSCEIAACAVQPGSPHDLGEILKAIKKHHVQFAVKGGGHATNPHFSSTTGIQISMCRFNKIQVDTTTTPPFVRVGAGCLFDEVYRKVVPHRLNIVGGSSIGGVGVAGWLQGGGYSLKTNHYGLGIDNLMEVQMVLPNGDPKTVGESSEDEDDKKLFEAVKGGGNNFGIITEFKIKAHRQGAIFGDLLTYEPEDYDDVKVAIANFALQTDPKAAIVAAFRYYNNPGGVESMLTVQCFYDGPYPDDPFAEFFEIDHKSISGGGDAAGHQSVPSPPKENFPLEWFHPTKRRFKNLWEYSSYEEFDQQSSFIQEGLDMYPIDIETIQRDSDKVMYYSGTGLFSNATAGTVTIASGAGANFAATESEAPRPTSMQPSSPNSIKRAMTGVGENPRGRWGNVMVDVYTKEIIDEIARQASKASRQMIGHGGKRVVIDIWPFTKTMFDNSTPSAWPHTKGEPNGPILAYFLWEGADNDKFWIETMKKTLQAIERKVRKVRGPDAKELPVYMNTTLDSTTTPEDIWGENLVRLGELRRKFDPGLVMNLTGGFRIPTRIIVPKPSPYSWILPGPM